jgi:hypothetical protein
VVVATVALVFGMLSLSKLEGPVCNRTRLASLAFVGIIDEPLACPYLSGSQLPSFNRLLDDVDAVRIDATPQRVAGPTATPQHGPPPL